MKSPARQKVMVVFWVAAIVFWMVSSASADILVSSGLTDTDSEVLAFTDGGAFRGVMVGPGNGLALPRGLALGPDGNLYVANCGGGNILRYNGRLGSFIDTFVPAGSGGLTSPEKVLFRGSYLYVCDFGPDATHPQAVAKVNRYDAATGAFVDTFIPSGSGGLHNAYDMAFDPTGTFLYVTDPVTAKVYCYNASTGAFLKVFFFSGLFYVPRGLTFGPDGNMYLSVEGTILGGNFVLKLDSTGVNLGTFVANGVSPLNGIRAVSFGPNGDFFAASQNNSGILRYDGLTGDYEGVFASQNGLTQPTFFIPSPPVLTNALGGVVLLLLD